MKNLNLDKEYAMEYKNKIIKLEATIETLLEEKKRSNALEANLQKKTFLGKYLAVKESHLPQMRGHNMFYKTIAEGRCLLNCLAKHAYNNEKIVR